MRLAMPFRYAIKAKMHGGVDIGIRPVDPGVGLLDNYAQLFLQFAPERMQHGFAGFHLAPGEFPVARIRLAVGPAGEKKAAVSPSDQRDGDFNAMKGVSHCSRRGVVFCFPAQSRANCHATRPLRDPRSSAHRNAASRTAGTIFAMPK